MGFDAFVNERLSPMSGLNEAYSKYKGAKTKRRSRISQALVSLFFVVQALVVTIDIAHSLFAAFHTELLNVNLIAIFYAVVQIPLIYFFLVYGTRVSTALLEQRDSVDKRSLEHALNFVHRVRLSGVALILNQANMVAFGTLGRISFWYCNLLYGCLFHTWGWVGLFQIAAVRPLVDLSFTSWLRRVSVISSTYRQASPNTPEVINEYKNDTAYQPE